MTPDTSTPARPRRSLPPLPLVGRDGDLAALGEALERAAEGRGGTVFLVGEGGVGKTRLAAALAERASGDGWRVLTGRGYPVETGVPYALFADAFLPVLQSLDAATLQLMTRGGVAELAALFPALDVAGAAGRSASRGDPADVKARLFWTFASFVTRFAARAPLLVVVENLQWADASSLELLHFVARQIAGARVLLLCTYNDAERDVNPSLGQTEQSLVALGVARTHHLAALPREETVRLVERAFGGDGAPARAFAERLYEWTRGNPFFIEETLKTLVEGGTLEQRGGGWTGWDVQDVAVPRSVRDAVGERLRRLGAPAFGVARWASVVGGRVSHDLLATLTGLSDDALLAALDELRAARILAESHADLGSADVRYEFAHPTLRETVYAGLGLARTRAMHADVAAALERVHAEYAESHAGEIAAHLLRADARALAPKAIRYLVAAGREALAASANREAASYLAAALDLADRGEPTAGGEGWSAGRIAAELARACQRLGEHEEGLRLWWRARDEAAAIGDAAAEADAERRMGLACYWSGRYDEALAHYANGLDAARRSDDAPRAARLQVARGACLQELGHVAEARSAVREALAIAERARDDALLARVHRALLLLHAWTGPPDEARRHGERALALAESSAQPAVAWSAHWAMALLGGLTGDAAATAHHVAESERLAESLRSPTLALWSAEVAIEYASGVGDWERGLTLAEHSVATARALGQPALLSRLLVWGGLIHLGRGDLARGRECFGEAWDLAGASAAADDRTATPLDVHTVIPAHVGMAAYHLAAGDRERAIAVGEAGLAVAERSGYVAWAVHRLLPIVSEAALWLSDFDRARLYGARMREASRQLDHRLGLAWADACDALVAELTGETGRAVDMLRRAADALDAVPYVLDGARLRRFLARALAKSGDREGAARELRRVHEVLARLGAEHELALTRAQIRELGGRPPVRSSSTAGAEGLTARELEICRLVAARKSNKEIGAALDISPRTVSTHLSNIFAKLGVESRGELTDLVRQRGWGE